MDHGFKRFTDVLLNVSHRPLIMALACVTTGSEACKILHSGSRLLPTPSRTAIATMIDANLDSIFTYTRKAETELLSLSIVEYLNMFYLIYVLIPHTSCCRHSANSRFNSSPAWICPKRSPLDLALCTRTWIPSQNASGSLHL